MTHRHTHAACSKEQQQLNTHPCLLSVVTQTPCVKDENSLYVVMSYVGGGELFDYVISRGKLSEREAAAIVRQLLSAVVYLHERHILHRDLKVPTQT